MASITVKKLDGTTDVTYVAIQPAGGAGTDAIWRVEAIGTIAGNRPVLKIRSKPTADGTANVVDWALSYPETMTNSTTGVISVRKIVKHRGTSIIPLDAADATNGESAAQTANLLKSTLFQSILTSGFAPV
jgi:hypothetical protein